MTTLLQYGIDVMLLSAAYKNKRLALVTNDASITAAGEKSRAALLRKGFTIVRLFSPEHGISTTGEDGLKQDHHTDNLTGLPVISLYGENMEPAPAMLNDVGAVIFDIPDIGCRYYTYLWTMTHVMEACERNNIPLVILDRPNPTGAVLQNAEGPWLDELHCSSFIGRWNIPLRHCCTLGELARFFAAIRLPRLQLQVIACNNYQRYQMAKDDFHFIPASPAMQTIESALLYPGMGLLEGINVNEGRGTAIPFQCFGAPWISSDAVKKSWQAKMVPGVEAVAINYIPESGLYAGTQCHGLRFIITDSKQVQPVAAGIHLLQTLIHLYPHQLTERAYPTVANPAGTGHLDKLLGLQHSFSRLQRFAAIDTTVNPEWEEKIGPYLLY